MTTNATSSSIGCRWQPQSTTYAHGKTGGQMTLPPPRVGFSLLCFSHRLGLAVHGGYCRQRAAKTKKVPPPPCSFVAQIVYRCTTPVLAAVSSTLEPMSKAAASLVRGLVAIVRSRWHLAVVAQTACRPVDQSLRRSWFCSALRRSVRLWSRCYHSVRDASWARRGVRARQCSGACCLGAARARAWGPSCCCSLIPSPYSGYRSQ